MIVLKLVAIFTLGFSNLAWADPEVTFQYPQLSSLIKENTETAITFTQHWINALSKSSVNVGSVCHQGGQARSHYSMHSKLLNEVMGRVIRIRELKADLVQALNAKEISKLEFTTVNSRLELEESMGVELFKQLKSIELEGGNLELYCNFPQRNISIDLLKEDANKNLKALKELLRHI